MSIRLRHHAAVNPATPEFELLHTDAEVPFLPLEAIWPGGRLDLSRVRKKGDVGIGYTRFREGDILVPKITPTFQADRTVIVDGLGGRPGTGTTELHVVRAGPSVERRYIRYLLSSKPFLDEGEASMVGVAGQKRVPDTCIRDLRIPVTDLAMQRAIADYLDAETARIDALIEKKRRMVEVLEERKEATIFHAITHGIHDHHHMDPAFLDWCDQIPSGWGTPTVSANFRLVLGKMVDAAAEAGMEKYRYLRNANVQWDRLDLEDLDEMEFSEADRERCRLVPGDLLVCEGGEVGRAAIWQGQLADCYFQKAVHRLRPIGTANARFLLYCLRAAAKLGVFSIQGNQSTIVHLTGEQLRVHRFPWPPETEQRAIVEFLDSILGQVDRVSDRLTLQVTLLREHRQALITAAVTGDPEVPDVAA